LPALPDSLKDLETLAKNMFWSWNPALVDLFKRIDSNLWAESGHNPIKFLGTVTQSRLESLAKNQAFLCELQKCVEKLNSYLNGTTWFDSVCSKSTKPIIAYFCAEFGLHECLPIYAGGLGILSGDHLKSASDIGVPIVGIGLLYQKGYFRQVLDIDGKQQEVYIDNDFYNLPVELVCKDSGRPLTISVEYPNRCVSAQIWCVSIGRIKLYLLDTNIPANTPGDRLITASLYGGDIEFRIRQEIMLGIGGLKALTAMGITPSVCHMNEGHAGFMALERIRQLRNDKNMTFDEAMEATISSNVFTMHTLVKAGLDEFPVDLMDKYFGGFFPHLGVNRNQFLALGRIFKDDENEPFKMPILAIKLSGYINGVSKLHGQISREVWSSLWPGVPLKEVPIIAITNGVHVKSWLADEISSLYEKYLGPNWLDGTFSNPVWNNVDEIPDGQLWQAHQRCKEHLIVFARDRLKAQLQRRGTCLSELNQADEVLDPEVLTIGFARRFVGYKRANLLLREPQRIIKLLTDPDRPVQIIFAGKAHPRDNEGKEIIKQIIRFASRQDIRRRIVFLEDYDIDIARVSASGVDIWLSNPRRPMEASGTSGMKAAINGVLNISTLDGWWCEGYQPEGGWVIGADQGIYDENYQDEMDARALYSILENEVVPLFYTRSTDNLPRAWIRKIKNSIKWIAPRFNTHRMVAQYTRRFYNPAAAKWRFLTAEACARARAFANWKDDIRKAWPQLAIENIIVEVANGNGYEQLNLKRPHLKVGSQLRVKTLVELGKLNPDNVSVELYYGPIDISGGIKDGSSVKMECSGAGEQQNKHWFTSVLPCRRTGQYGIAVRVLPYHSDLINPYDLQLILWGNTAST
ncbi:MAG: hypothetical protein A2173_07505, partial [Planctomycetes bacterium RBG_13_44_8b]